MRRALIFFCVLIFLANVSFAETTCEVSDCEITIKLKIAFVGANDTYINNAENEIESVWNGPSGSRTYGDCKCKVKFDVETKKVTNQANCTPPIADHHCVMVTNFFNATGQYDNPPRNQTNITGATVYIGYMYGIATGNGSNSQQGWWSDQMSRPVPGSTTGENYKDFAHEAGHMMGLEDGDGGIMNTTSGANSNPTQANIDEIVDDICGPNACPDRCCCGNGVVDKNKGEGCDPKATPVGCSSGQQCCAVCCSCFGPICSGANNEYISHSECQSKCGTDATCYKDFKTGCWDCVKDTVVISGSCRDPTNIRGNTACDHIEYGFGKGAGNILIVPVVGGLFSDERMNYHIEGMGEAHVILKNEEIDSYGLGHLDEPTMNIYTDSGVVSQIYGGSLSINQALKDESIRMEGVGFFNSLKVGIHNFFFGIFGPDNGEFVPVVEDPYPQEYYDELDTEDEIPIPEDSTPGLKDLPDMPYTGE
jgi:hypothetical protein